MWQNKKQKLKFDNSDLWSKTVEHLKTLPTITEKIKYLIEQKTSYKQYFSAFDFIPFDETSYDENCELEIKKLKAFAELEKDANNVSQKTLTPISKFKLKEGIISKADYIRIINVFSEMRAFENEDKKLIDKKDLMIVFGNLVKLDFSNYAPDLNKALGQSEKSNIEIFEKMKVKAANIWEEKLKKENK